MRISCIASCLALCLFIQSASPAAIVGVYTPLTNTDVDFDLTALGTTDWAYWHTTAGSGAGAKTNEKAGGSLISGLSPIGGGGLRGSGSAFQAYDFLFTDGTSPTMGSQNNLIGVFNTQIGVADVGVSLGVLMPELGTYTINVWVGAFTATGQFTASAPGLTSFTDSSLVGNGNGDPRQGALYTLTVSPQTAGDTLSLSYVQTSITGGSANAEIAGVSVSFVPIPEPSSLLLCGGGLMAVLLILKKQRSRAALV